MQVLRQSTAVDVLIGPFVDRTDGYTSETGESPTVKLSKNGQTLAAKNDATTPTHDADGYYNCELDATDTNTIGTLILTVAASANALPVRHEFQVLDESAYDAIYGSPATILTSADVGLMYESTVSTVTSQTQLDMADAFATDDVAIGNIVTIVDAGNAANFHTTWVADLDQTNDRIIINDAPPWTIATSDTVRIYAHAHPGYHANAQITANALATKDNVLGYLQLLARSDAAIYADRATELGELNANEGSGAGDYDPRDASLEHGNTKRMNNTTVKGTGTTGDLWRG